MSQRPSLKLKFSSASLPKQSPAQSPPVASTPLTSTPKIKLKFGSFSQAPKPEPSSITTPTPGGKPKPVRKSKPTPKKRALEAESEEEDDAPAPSSSQGPALKKIRLKTNSAPVNPIIHLKAKGKPPKRPRGVGYDSEADDREADPTISEAVILRMQPGEDCDLIRQACADGNWGHHKKGGVDVRIRFVRSDGRRACISVQGRHYAAILVDLPCVIEAMKSFFPKHGWMKSADVCQMLIVLGRIGEESEAGDHPLPGLEKGELDEKTWQWAHGLTPPMRWVRRRRFRKRISVRTVMEVEAEVENLLREDEQAGGESKFELIDERKLEQEASAQEDEDLYGEGEDDAEGEDDQADYMNTVENEEDEEAAAARLAAEMEAGMMGDDDDEAHPDATTQPSTGPSFESPQQQTQPLAPSAPLTPRTSFDATATPSAAPSPAVVDTSSAAEEEEEEEESSDEDADDEVDADQLEKQQDLQRQREEIADLEAAIKQEQLKVSTMGNALLRKRLVEKIKGLQGDLEVKRANMGLGGEE